MKTFIQILVACLVPISLVAQLRAPENVPIGFYGKVLEQNRTPVTGATVNFDILTSHMSEDRTESTHMVLQTDQGGNFVLTGVTGYLAPENGYSPSFTVAQKVDDPKWRVGVTQEFYIKTADGHYGRLFVDWYAWQTPPVHMEWN
jgi:hypothetical protein